MAIGEVGNTIADAANRATGGKRGLTAAQQAILMQASGTGGAISAPSAQAAATARAFAGGNMTPEEFIYANKMTPYNLPQFGAGGNVVQNFRPATPMGAVGSTGVGQAMGNPLPQMNPAATGVGATAAGDSAILKAAGLPTASSGAASTAMSAEQAFGAAGAKELVTKPLGKFATMFNKIPGANFSRASLPGAAGAFFAGQLGSSIVGGMDIGGENSNVDQSLSGGIEGAGIGGALALGLGLSGPVGWAVAGTGALLGAIFSAQEEGGTTQERMQKTATNTTKTIQELTATYGLSQEDAANIMLQHDAATRLFIQNKDKAGLDAYVQQLSSVLPQQMLQLKQSRDQETSHYKRVMDMQAQFAPMFSSIMGRSAESNTIAYEQAVKAADTLKADNPQLAALIQSSAADSRSNSDALMAAYASQIAMAPSQQEYQNYYAGQQIYNANTTGNGGGVGGLGGLTTSQQNQLAQLQALTAAGY